MKEKNPNNSKRIFIKPTLSDKLNSIFDYPCTSVVAPIGFGKSSTLYEFLNNSDPQFKTVFKKVVSSETSSFWAEFSSAFELDFPECFNPETDSEQKRLLRQQIIQLSNSMGGSGLIVVVDFDLYLPTSEVKFFLDGFVRLLSDNMHLILISRVPVFHPDSTLSFYGIVNSISKSDLIFNANEIQEYYSFCGIEITNKEADDLFSFTSGWIALLFNGIQLYKETGRIITSDECMMLIKKAVLSHVDEKTRQILLFSLLCKEFSSEEMEFLCEDIDVGSVLHRLVEEDLFISLNTLTGIYHLHPLFSSALQREFNSEDLEKRNSFINRLGQWYMKISENHLARQCFYTTENYEALMQAVEKRRFLHPYVGDESKFISYYSDTPAEIRRKYPKAMLIFAKQLYSRNEKDLAEAVCKEFLQSVKQIFDVEKSHYYMGLYELLLCYGCYNNLDSMLSHLSRAEKYFVDVHDKIIWPETGFNDFPSILALYHRTPGKMDEECEKYKEYNKRYSRFSDDRIAGADLVMQAEALFMRGNLAGSEIVANRAMLGSNKALQWGVWLSVKFTQIRIQLLNGKWEEVQFLLDEVRSVCNKHEDYMLIPAIELCEAYVYSKLGMLELLKNSFSDDSWEERMGINSRALPLIYTLYAEVLLSREEFVKLLARSQDYINTAAKYPNTIAMIILYIEIAGAYEHICDNDNAVKNLENAINLSSPDDVIMPYVENYTYIKDALSILQKKYPEFVKRVKKEAAVFEGRIAMIRKRYFSKNDFNLTATENKIALLVAQGLSNKDIASEMYVSEATVKTHLMHIFAKMNIHKRAQLRKLI